MASIFDRASVHDGIPSHIPPDLVFDFDLFNDARLVDDVQQGLMSLHRDAPDIFYTPRNGGHWVATRFADVTRIMTTPSLFSSVDVRFREETSEQGKIPIPPQDMDAPDHLRHRLLMLQFLSPKNFRQQEPHIRRLTIELIDGLQGRTGCDFKEEIAVTLPVTIFMTMMEWDLRRYREFVSWAHDVGTNDPSLRATAFRGLSQYLTEIIQSRLESPGDDPISILLRSEVKGERLSLQRVREMATLLFIAGLDTVTNAMTFMMKHLAEHPETQRLLKAEPHLVEPAVEEFLRRYAFANTHRRVSTDTEVGGVALRAGETIVCSLAAASNDDRSIPSPEQFDVGRSPCPHVAFNVGPHNCIGAPLARLELRILLEEWLRRMPEVSLVPGFSPKGCGGVLMSVDRLEIVW